MVFIAEIVLLLCGIWTLVTGRVPAAVTGSKFRLQGTNARYLGGIMVLPIPLSVVAGVVLAMMGEEAVKFSVLAHASAVAHVQHGR